VKKGIERIKLSSKLSEETGSNSTQLGSVKLQFKVIYFWVIERIIKI
jgi:hypothetical protein